MNQRSTIGSTILSARVPNGMAMAAAMMIGSTSRQVQRGISLTVNGDDARKSTSSNVTAAVRGSYTAATSGM
jgi:hypothetical protein